MSLPVAEYVVKINCDLQLQNNMNFQNVEPAKSPKEELLEEIQHLKESTLGWLQFSCMEMAKGNFGVEEHSFQATLLSQQLIAQRMPKRGRK